MIYKTNTLISVILFSFLQVFLVGYYVIARPGVVEASHVSIPSLYCQRFRSTDGNNANHDLCVQRATNGEFGSEATSLDAFCTRVAGGSQSGADFDSCVSQYGHPNADAGDETPDAGGVGEPNYIKNDCSGPNISAGEDEDSDNHCGILDYLVLFINILSALVGVVVVASIIYGGIQYSTAGSDPQKVSAAKQRIRNAIIALIFFIFTYSILNYLVPGGVL